MRPSVIGLLFTTPLLSLACLSACVIVAPGDDEDGVTDDEVGSEETTDTDSTDTDTETDTTEADTETTGTETDTTETDTGEPDPGRLFVSNSLGDSIVIIDPLTGEVTGEFVAPGEGGLDHPDTMRVRGDLLLVASGVSPENSAILGFDLETGDASGVFAEGGGLLRPYGFDFGPDGDLYVASFLSDELLHYDGDSGDFVEVAASGDAMPGGLNGPNDVVLGPDGALYISTQGSVAVDGEPTYPGLPSEVLRFDVETLQLSVFVAQPVPLPDSLGFVSMLGLGWEPGCDETCALFTSDFAGGLRRYTELGELVWEVSTTYTEGAITGALTFGSMGEVFLPGSVDEVPAGVVQRFDMQSGDALPGEGLDGALFVPSDEALIRPIGTLYVAE